MTDEEKVIDATAEEIGPDPELKDAVDDLLPVVVKDPADEHELMVRMDEADVQALLTWSQEQALRRWIYDFKDGKRMGLTVHAVQDITQRMNWTGKARIGLLLDTNGHPVLDVEVIEADEGNGPEPFWSATAYAKDELTGMVLPGASMEPQNMRLKNGKTKFDRFARWKAIQKATRNALGAFIPEVIEQTVIAMFAGTPERVQRIETEAEHKLAELPPPLDDEKARELIAQAKEIYSEIRELGGGRGKVKFTPDTFRSWMLQSQHSHERLEDFLVYLNEQRERIPAALKREDEEREAIDTAAKVPCPKCGAGAGKDCSGVRGAHGERVRARLEEIRA